MENANNNAERLSPPNFDIEEWLRKIGDARLRAFFDEKIRSITMPLGNFSLRDPNSIRMTEIEGVRALVSGLRDDPMYYVELEDYDSEHELGIIELANNFFDEANGYLNNLSRQVVKHG